MGDHEPSPATPTRPGVAAFDFDGTLSSQDTMMPFLVRTHGWPRIARHALFAGPTLLPRNAKPRAGLRDGIKVATVGRLFRGMTVAELDDLGSNYAEGLTELLRADMVERLRWHQDQGHATVIVSASLAVYLRPVAVGLGMDGVLGVELAPPDAPAEHQLTGKIEGGRNTRGPHKVTRLRTWLDERFSPGAEVELWAYGDSSGDTELLAAADHPTWVK